LTGAAAAASAIMTASAASRLNSSDPNDQSFIFRRLAYAVAGLPGFWRLRGTRYALIDGELTPLWNMNVGGLFVVHGNTKAGPGAYTVTSISTSFYTDLHAGAFLTRFQNPFTGQTVPIGYFPPQPNRSTYGRDGLIDTTARLPHGFTTCGPIGPAWIEGDAIGIEGDHLVSDGSAAPRVRVNDLTTYVGSLREVLDPTIAVPNADITFNDINTWPPWLQMGERPGNYFSRAAGRKEARYDRMPPTWRQLIQSQYPLIARDPAAALAG
jgi:hypothetical protein